jgi:hypothetical protein
VHPRAQNNRIRALGIFGGCFLGTPQNRFSARLLRTLGQCRSETLSTAGGGGDNDQDSHLQISTLHGVGAEALNQRREIFGVGGFDINLIYLNARGMQHVTLRSRGILFGAVGAIAQHGMSKVSQRHANLVQESRSRAHFHQRTVTERFQNAHLLLRHPHRTRTVTCGVEIHDPNPSRAVLGNSQSNLNGMNFRPVRLSGD